MTFTNGILISGAALLVVAVMYTAFAWISSLVRRRGQRNFDSYGAPAERSQLAPQGENSGHSEGRRSRLLPAFLRSVAAPCAIVALAGLGLWVCPVRMSRTATSGDAASQCGSNQQAQSLATSAPSGDGECIRGERAAEERGFAEGQKVAYMRFENIRAGGLSESYTSSDLQEDFWKDVARKSYMAEAKFSEVCSQSMEGFRGTKWVERGTLSKRIVDAGEQFVLRGTIDIDVARSSGAVGAFGFPALPTLADCGGVSNFYNIFVVGPKGEKRTVCDKGCRELIELVRGTPSMWISLPAEAIFEPGELQTHIRIEYSLCQPKVPNVVYTTPGIFARPVDSMEISFGFDPDLCPGTKGFFEIPVTAQASKLGCEWIADFASAKKNGLGNWTVDVDFGPDNCVFRYSASPVGTPVLVAFQTK